MSNSKTIFCLLDCFDNYSIVAGKVIEFYIQNASKALNPTSNIKIKTFFENTPYIFYSMFMNSSVEVPLPIGITRSKQLTSFITILSLTAVTLAQINRADTTVWGMQGSVPNPGFATMYTIANQLNKITAYWTDDLRNLWGVSDNPLMIGMAPLPYKYLWNASSNPQQTSDMNVQVKGLNGPLVVPELANPKNLCPVISEEQFKDKWNSFFRLLKDGESVQSQNVAGVSKRTHNLIKLGEALIQSIESKEKQYGHGWNYYTNSTLYLDMELVIYKNIHLYIKKNRLFLQQIPHHLLRHILTQC